jgi:hypothetical protein
LPVIVGLLLSSLLSTCLKHFSHLYSPDIFASWQYSSYCTITSLIKASKSSPPPLVFILSLHPLWQLALPLSPSLITTNLCPGYLCLWHTLQNLLCWLGLSLEVSSKSTTILSPPFYFELTWCRSLDIYTTPKGQHCLSILSSVKSLSSDSYCHCHCHCHFCTTCGVAVVVVRLHVLLPRQVAKLPIPWVLYHYICYAELALHIDDLISQLSPSKSSYFGSESDHVSAPLLSPFTSFPVSDVHHPWWAFFGVYLLSPSGCGVTSVPNRVQYSHADPVSTAEDLSSQTTKSRYHVMSQVIRITCEITW